MLGTGESEFLDLVYGAALDPALWVPVIERYADLVGGQCAWLSQLNLEDGSGAAEGDPISRIDPVWLIRYADHFATRNPLAMVKNPQAFLRQWTLKILTDEDWMAKDDLVQTEYFNDFLRPQGIDSALMVRLAARGAEVAHLNVTRPPGRGQFDRSDLEIASRLHPHLVRAFQLGQKFAPTRRMSGDIISLLDLSLHGLFLLDVEGQLLHVNRAGEALLREQDAIGLIGGQLTATISSEARRLQALIAAAACRDPELRTGGSMALASPTRRLPFSITVAPVSAEPLTPFRNGATVIVCITDLEAGITLPEQKMRELFGLTPAEARVALALFEGASPADAAARFGVSLNTVLAQLARIFEKTGTHKQVELVRLMMRAVGVNLG